MATRARLPVEKVLCCLVVCQPIAASQSPPANRRLLLPVARVCHPRLLPVPVAHVTLAPPSFSISAQQEYEVKHLLNQTRLNTETGKWQVPVVYLTEFINVENIVDPHHATFKNGNKPENWEQICGVCRSSG